MSQTEKNAYILGTTVEELHRLGIQHQVWAEETSKAWRLGGFNTGQHILDLGCGPGFCTTELAYIAGSKGQVYGIDKSAAFIQYLDQVSAQASLNINTQCTEFDHMDLPEQGMDRIYARWALAWIPNPEEIIGKLHKTLKKDGIIVCHEYLDWSTFQTEPYKPNLTKAIRAALKSFKEQEGDIDIGRRLPQLFTQSGFEVLGTRPISKMARPSNFTWQWPRSFFEVYFHSLVTTGYLTDEEVQLAIADAVEMDADPNSILLCPQMIEVIAKKI